MMLLFQPLKLCYGDFAYVSQSSFNSFVLDCCFELIIYAQVHSADRVKPNHPVQEHDVLCWLHKSNTSFHAAGVSFDSFQHPGTVIKFMHGHVIHSEVFAYTESRPVTFAEFNAVLETNSSQLYCAFASGVYRKELVVKFHLAGFGAVPSLQSDPLPVEPDFDFSFHTLFFVAAFSRRLHLCAGAKTTVVPVTAAARTSANRPCLGCLGRLARGLPRRDPGGFELCFCSRSRRRRNRAKRRGENFFSKSGLLVVVDGDGAVPARPVTNFRNECARSLRGSAIKRLEGVDSDRLKCRKRWRRLVADISD
jgi:hypothetical protein